MRLLIVEDDRKIANSIKQGLEQESFAVDVAYSGDFGYDLAVTEDYDLIILDLIWVEKILKYDKVYLLKLLFKSIIASLIMWLVLWLVIDWFNIILLVILGSIAYFSAMFLLGGLNLKDLINVKKLLK